MPAIQPGSLVLLTGASGYLATHILVQLLQRGFRVRGTVRSADKGQYLERMLEREGVKGDVEFVVVDNVEKPDAFSEATKGCDAIVHTASPFHFNVSTPSELIDPAVRGTLSALKAADAEKSVQRVVVTASFACVVEPHEPGTYTFTEKDWNEYSIKQVEEKGDACDKSQMYRASKTLAERAAWGFLSSTQPAPAFDLVTIQPPLIFGGPLYHDVPTADKLNTSVNNFYQFLAGNKGADDAQVGFGSFVDVRDVALVHVESLLREEAGGERFLVATDDSSYQPLLDTFFAHAPPALQAAFPNAQRGNAGQAKPKANRIDTSKVRGVFGWTPRSMEDTVCVRLSMAQSLADYQEKWAAAA